MLLMADSREELGYIDISTSELGTPDQHSEVNVGSGINFGVSRSIRFR